MIVSRSKTLLFVGSAVVAITMFAGPGRGQVVTPVPAPVAHPIPASPPPLPAIPRLPAPLPPAPLPAAPVSPAPAPIKAAPPARAAGGGGCSSYLDCQIEEHRHAHPAHEKDCDKPENLGKIACRWDRGYTWAKTWDVKSIATCQRGSTLAEVVAGCVAYVKDNH